MEYFKTMPWLMIKFEDRALDEDLSREYDISGSNVVVNYLLLYSCHYNLVLPNFSWLLTYLVR